MKYIIFIFLNILSNNIFCQSNIITIVAKGDGNTESQAVNHALRNAIEKTFGVFISSTSLISNDELINDEIATVSSGNIIKYEVLAVFAKENLFEVTVSAQVSPEKVVINLKKKGQAVELQGNVYAQNVKVEQFYKEQEINVINDFIKTYKDFWIIDSLAFFPCEPIFFDLNKVQLPYGESFDHRNPPYNNCYIINNNLPTRTYKINSEGLFSAFTSDDERRLKQEQVIKIGSNKTASDNELLSQEQYKILNDYYVLPVMIKPYYNIKNAFTISKALIQILNAISIKNIEDYKAKMGDIFEMTLVSPKDYKRNLFFTVPLNNNNADLKTWKKENITVWELYSYEQKNNFALRNPQSLSLLKSFFDIQFSRSGVKSIYLKSPIKHGFIHFVSHGPHRENARCDGLPDDIRSRWRYDNFNENCINILPNLRYGTDPNASLHIIPYILYIGLSIDDLQMLKKIEIDWISNKK